MAKVVHFHGQAYRAVGICFRGPERIKSFAYP